MAKFYKDRHNREYSEIGGYKFGKHPRDAIMKTIDDLMEEHQIGEVIESEIEKNSIPFEQEIPFTEGFKIGLGFMLWMTMEGKIKSLLVDVRKHKKHTWRGRIAAFFGVTPFDFIDEDNYKE